jgi:iron complex transport system substrate-binding protein
MLRTVSLLPAATEIACAVGAADSLLAISHRCDHPPEVLHLPRVTRDGALDFELLRQLRPDLILTQDLCSTCAVSRAQVETWGLHELPDSLRVLSLQPQRLDDLFANIREVGEALRHLSTAEELCGGLQRRLQEVRSRCAQLGSTPTVLTLEWIEPPMTGGYWTPDLISVCGGTPLIASAGQPSRVITAGELAAVEPEVVVVKPCGFTLDAALDSLRTFRAQVPWRRWPAARNGRVYFVDGNAWFNRPGPRLIDSAEVLALCLYPESFRDHRRAYGHGIARITTDLLVERW